MRFFGITNLPVRDDEIQLSVIQRILQRRAVSGQSQGEGKPEQCPCQPLGDKVPVGTGEPA